MANTEISTSAGAENQYMIEQIWSARAFKWAQETMYFNKRFVSKSADNIIQTKTDLTVKKGDKVRFRLRAPLSSAGVVDDATLEGNEEAMNFYYYDVTVHQRRHAVRIDGKMTEQRTSIPLRMEAREGLGDWLAQTMDTDTVLVLSGLANAAGALTASTPSTNRRWVGGQTTAGVVTQTASNLDAELGSGTGGKTYADMLFGTAVISYVKRLATIAGSGYPKIRPIMIDGQAHYVMFVHPWQAKAVKSESAWLQAQREANVRGDKNPIFSGSLGIWDNVILHEFEKIEVRVGDGVGSDPATYFESGDAANSSSETIARALFCGAQAGVHAYAQYPSWKEKLFDYDNQTGVSTGLIWQPGRTRFNSEDFANIAVDTCCVPDS